MNVIKVKLSDLKPDPKNTRRHDERNIEAVKTSLKQFGQYRPFVVQKNGMIIRVGNGMFEAMRQLGWDEGDAVVLDMTDNEAATLSILDNRSSELATWDTKMLAEIWKELPTELAEATFFSEDEIKNLLKVDLADVGKNLAVVDEDGESEPVVISDSVYCPIYNRLDLGTGACSFKCQYCYIKNSCAKKPIFIRPAKHSILSSFFSKLKKDDVFLTGCAIDPSMPELEGNLLYAMSVCEKKDNIMYVQTKNPLAIYEIAKKFHKLRLVVKTSFSFADERAVQIEPGAPSVEKRIEGITKLKESGFKNVIRLQPFFCGETSHFSDLLQRLNGFVECLVCEPIRISKTWTPYISGIFSAAKVNFEEYKKNYFLEKTYGAYHWYDYEPDKLRKEYESIKKMANKNGMYFGICSGVAGYVHSDLNDLEYCCKVFDGANVDRDALCCVVHSGGVEKLMLDYVAKARDIDVNLDRLGWINSEKLYIYRNKKT